MRSTRANPAGASVSEVAIQRVSDAHARQVAALRPYRPGEARARELGRVGGLAKKAPVERRRYLVELMESSLEAGLGALRSEFAELSAKVISGKKLTRTEKKLLLTIGELLLKHCRHILPQEVIAAVAIFETPPTLSDGEIAALKASWQRVQEVGLLGEGGQPVGAPEDFVDLEPEA